MDNNTPNISTSNTTRVVEDDTEDVPDDEIKLNLVATKPAITSKTTSSDKMNKIKQSAETGDTAKYERGSCSEC